MCLRISCIQPDGAASKAGGPRLSPSAIHGANQWPDATVPQLSAIMNDYVSRMNRVGAAVMRGIALGLSLEDSKFFETSNRGQDPYWCMRIIHYPPLVAVKNAETALAGRILASMWWLLDANEYGGVHQIEAFVPLVIKPAWLDICVID
jgi:isopenicillin N synthase-like dioxygenase